MKKRIFGIYHFLWAWVGARLHGDPSRRIFTIGVTGTKGKTTTLELLNAILEAAGKRTALLSSLRVKIGEETKKNPTGNSMPGRGYIQAFLAKAQRARCSYALIEVTSQGAAQHRHRFVQWNVGVITNLHPEHIEAHGTFEKYRAAKLSFLKYVLERGGKVFLNQEDKEFDFFAKELARGGKEPMLYARSDERLQDHVSRIERTRERQDAAAPSRFVLSDFNQENIAAAIAIAKELGIAERIIEEAIANFEGVSGRMEFVRTGPYTVIVDYAHTPESLEAAYRAARRERAGADAKLICVLGAAGGGRDAWKRPEFGEIAAHYCDEIILTDEDPYDENPETILQQIEEGIARMPYPRPTAQKILDRRAALAAAISAMREGDVVIATGKGSEDWIHRARGKKIPWNEKAIVEELLMLKKAGKAAAVAK